MDRILRTGCISVVAAAVLFAQALPPSPVVGVGTFIHVVADLDKTIHFYGERLGLEMTGAPGPRAFSANEVVENLYDAKGSQSRVAVFRIPGSPLGLEFVEFKGIVQKPFRPRLQDPGASVVSLPIRDVDSVMAKLREDSTPVIGGQVVKDPDGFYVHLGETGSRATLNLTVDNMDRTLALFRDLLGFRFERGRTLVPGTNFEVDFAAFPNADRQRVAQSIHDPGAGVLRLVVSDVDALLATLKDARVPVVSVGGQAFNLGGRHFVILRDPDNFFFQLVPAPPPSAK